MRLTFIVLAFSLLGISACSEDLPWIDPPKEDPGTRLIPTEACPLARAQSAEEAQAAIETLAECLEVAEGLTVRCEPKQGWLPEIRFLDGGADGRLEIATPYALCPYEGPRRGTLLLSFDKVVLPGMGVPQDADIYPTQPCLQILVDVDTPSATQAESVWREALACKGRGEQTEVECWGPVSVNPGYGFCRLIDLEAGMGLIVSFQTEPLRVRR